MRGDPITIKVPTKWFWRIWWWIGYHGPYQIIWWIKDFIVNTVKTHKPTKE